MPFLEAELNTYQLKYRCLIFFLRVFNLQGEWPQARFGFANHLALVTCFVSSNKWVQIEKHPIKAHFPSMSTLTTLGENRSCYIWNPCKFLVNSSGETHGWPIRNGSNS